MSQITKIDEVKDDSLLTIPEVAQLLRVDHATVRRWSEQGILETVFLPHRGKRKLRRVKGSTFMKILSSNK